LGDHKAAQRYFKLSMGKNNTNKEVLKKSKSALADYNYNQRKYKAAIPLYEDSLGATDERWWTKDAFNLAWSYYRVQNYNKAISLMIDIHKKSGSSKFIDMRSQVERDIGIFYTDAGLIDQAIKFYTSVGINYTEQFVKIAQAIVSQGRYSQAENLLNEAAKVEKDRSRLIIIYLAQLDLFYKFNRTPKHLEVSRRLVDYNKQKKLDSEDLKKLVFHVDRQAAELQKSVTGPTYKSVPKVLRSRSSQAIEYFGLSAELQPNLKVEKIFYQGETAYAANRKTEALNFYISSFDLSKAQKNQKMMNQSLEGMLSTLQSVSKSKNAEKYYLDVYIRYLSVDTKSDRAKTIFVKLFNVQYDSKNITEAEKTLEAFAQSHPSDFKTQEAMLAKIMEYYRTKKDYNRIKGFVTQINDGKYKVSKKYADALKTLLTSIQIEGVQESLNRGHKDVALKGYHGIYESSESTPNAKINAAYNLSALYYELGDLNTSYKWSTIAVKDMEVKDVMKFTDSYLSIAAGLFLRHHFEQSSDLSYRILAKICNENTPNKDIAFKNSVFIALSNNNIDKAIEVRNFGRGCKVSLNAMNEVNQEIVKDLFKEKRWEQLESELLALDRDPKNSGFLIKYFEELETVYLKVSSQHKTQEMRTLANKNLSRAKKLKVDVPVETLDVIADRQIENLLFIFEKITKENLRFPENEFNQLVKSKLQLLDQMTNQVTRIQSLGSGRGIVRAYYYVINAYEQVGKELRDFTPEGKSPEYVQSFKKAMSQVYNPLLQNANKQRNEIKSLILKNSILSEFNTGVIYGEENAFKRFIPTDSAVLMDRGGKR